MWPRPNTYGLADAGYPGGVGFPTLRLCYNATDFNQRLLEAVTEQWRTNLNIRYELVPRSWLDHIAYLSSCRGNPGACDYDPFGRQGWV